MATARKIRDELGFPAYVPEYVPDWRAARGDDERSLLFPQYLFVHFDPAVDGWRDVHHMTGVDRLLGASPEDPTPLPEGVIEELLSRPEIPASIRPLNLSGKTLRIEGGPWHEFEGICKWSRDKRVGVLLSLFGRTTIASIPREQVKVI